MFHKAAARAPVPFGRGEAPPGARQDHLCRSSHLPSVAHRL